MTAIISEPNDVYPLPVLADGPAVFEFPCSRVQRRFWILDQLQPGAPWLNIAVRWRLEGRVDPALFEAAFRALIHRHEILRTGFVEIDGDPRQRFESEVRVDLPVIDLTSFPPSEREAKATRITLDLARQPFALDRPPLIHAGLLRLGDAEWRVLFNFHHIIGDGWSVGIIVRDLADLYERALHPGRPSLPPPELQYADFALWDATRPKTEATVAHRYWETHLKGLRPFELITDRPRPATRQGRGAIVSRLLPIALTETANRWARARGATLFPLTLATLAVVLRRFSTEPEIVVGTQVAGRSRVEMEPVIGPFINTVVLRVDTSGSPNFSMLFERTRQEVEGAIAHAETPFEDLVDIVRPTRSTAHHPLFQINLIHQRSFVPDRQHLEFALRDMPSLSPGAPYDLNFFMVERREGWRLSCEYDLDLFEAETVGRLLALFEAVLATATGDADRPIDELATAGPQDLALIAGWNDTNGPIPALSLPAMIAAQAESTPHSCAVTSGTEHLSYAELERRANRLAHLLIARGVRPGARVGICLDRSVLLPVALLAVLKTGAAYVPLDPDYPVIRLVQMAEDADLRALVTCRKYASVVPSRGEARILLDALTDMSAPLAEDCPDIRRSPTDISYVLFTSGSTGRPKGVEISDGALVNLLTAMRRTPGLDSHDVLVAVTSASFDIAALELFLPLVAGARLIVATQAETRDGAALTDLLRREGATVLQATPATFQLLLDSGWDGVQHLKMLCGGEALPKSLAARLLPHGELWNMYGPTETTIWSSVLAVRESAATVPIGRPIANTRFEVLDKGLRPVPIGAPGELLIGGAGLARGYLGKPHLTAERFIVPSDPALGRRLYKTGDLVRWRPDGTLEFLGRLDQQVKLRGHRIELGEIEAVLAQYPAVAAAAVTLQKSPAGEDRLVAFIVPESSAGPHAELTAYLQQRAAALLPAYMRPSLIIAIAALPLTPNGKLDRARLPQADVTVPAEVSEPLDATERRLAQIWQEMLGTQDIGRHSDFFELGGDFLGAARLVARLRREFGTSVAFAALFENATLGRIARLIDAPAAADPSVVVLRRAGTANPIWGIATPTIFRKLSGQLAVDRPFHVVRSRTEDIAAVLACDTLEQIASHYLEALRRAQPAAPYALLGFCSDAAVAYEMARQLEQAGETVDLLILIDAWAPGYTLRLGTVRGALANAEYKMRRSLDLFGRLTIGLVRAIRTGDPWAITADLPRSDPVYGASAEARLHAHTTDCARRAQPATFGGTALIVKSAIQPSGLFLDRQLGWRDLVRGGTHVITVPGDHLGIFFEPGVGVLASGIDRFAEPSRHTP